MTPTDPVITDLEKRTELERVRACSALHNAPMLQKLLDFLAHRASQGDYSEISEYTVASEVFGRSGEFDPTGDTTVRTAVYRLRAKLRDYYASEGKLDAVVIEVPKGKYSIQFARRPSEMPDDSSARHLSAPLSDTLEHPSKMDRGTKPAVWFALGAAAVVLFAAGIVVGNQFRRSTSSVHAGLDTDAATAFWRNFAGPDNSVLVTFANVEMLHTDSGDLLKFEGGAIGDRGAKVERSVAEKSVATPGLLGKQTFFYEDGYSGTGEVQAVYSLARLLAKSGIGMQVKRSRLVTNDDLKNHNVVHLGAGRENLAIDDLHLKQGFVFESPRFSMWSNRILDKRNALPDGRTAYAIEREASTGTLKVDYALFSVVPGLAPGRRIMLLAGLTTSGTEAAAEFATSDSQMSSLLRNLRSQGSFAPNAAPPFFESILQVRVVRGLDPIEVKCVAARSVQQ